MVCRGWPVHSGTTMETAWSKVDPPADVKMTVNTGCRQWYSQMECVGVYDAEYRIICWPIMFLQTTDTFAFVRVIRTILTFLQYPHIMLNLRVYKLTLIEGMLVELQVRSLPSQ